MSSFDQGNILLADLAIHSATDDDFFEWLPSLARRHQEIFAQPCVQWLELDP